MNFSGFDENLVVAMLRQLWQAAARFRELGQYRDAIACWEALATGDETYESGEYAFEIGKNYESLGDLKEALRYFELAERWNPGIPDRLAAVARIRAKLGP